MIERAVLLAQGDEIEEPDLQLNNSSPASNPKNPTENMTLEQAESWFIQQALDKHSGNANEAAEALGISRSALYRRLGKN